MTWRRGWAVLAGAWLLIIATWTLRMPLLGALAAVLALAMVAWAVWHVGRD